MKNHRVKFALCLLTLHIWMTAQCKVQQPVDKNFAPKKRNQSRENERAWFCCSGGWVARLFNHAHRTFWGWRWAHSRSKLSPSTSKVSTKYFLHPPSPLSLIGQLTDQVVVDVQWSVRNWVRNVEHGEKMVHADWSLQSASPIVDHPLNQSKLRFGRGRLWPKAQLWKKVCTLPRSLKKRQEKEASDLWFLHINVRMLQTIKKSSLLLPPFIPKGEDHANDILCGWGIAIIYGDLPFTVHVCTGLSTLPAWRRGKIRTCVFRFWCSLSEKVNYCQIVWANEISWYW